MINRKNTLLFLGVIAVLGVSCNKAKTTQTADSDFRKWQLGWRMVNSFLDRDYEVGEQQFDSLLRMDGHTETMFLVTGLEILHEQGDDEKLMSVLSKQDPKTLEEICNKELFTV